MSIYQDKNSGKLSRVSELLHSKKHTEHVKFGGLKPKGDSPHKHTALKKAQKSAKEPTEKQVNAHVRRKESIYKNLY